MESGKSRFRIRFQCQNHHTSNNRDMCVGGGGGHCRRTRKEEGRDKGHERESKGKWEGTSRANSDVTVINDEDDEEGKKETREEGGGRGGERLAVSDSKKCPPNDLHG